MNMVETILSRASGGGKVRPGDVVDVDVDCCVMHDLSFTAQAWRTPLRLADPGRLVVVFDHIVPSSTPAMAAAHQLGRQFVQDWGITRFHDIGRNGGICHQIVAEFGYARPGAVLLCADSHASSAGAFNCAARGIAQADLLAAMTTGRAWFEVGETIRYDLHGAFPPGVSAKDLFLFLAQEYGDHAGCNIEFHGPGVLALSMTARRTLATMATELSAEFAVFGHDDVLAAHMRDCGVSGCTPAHPGADAAYAAIRTVHLDAIEPLVALPDAVVRNSVPVRAVAGTPIQQAFIGSCANGTLEDLAAAAAVLDGQHVAPGVRLIITPASQAVALEAARRGYAATFLASGAVVTNATCGPCAGLNFGALGPGETCITASTRNFKGRMGAADARIYMASPATVAASAIAGRIAQAQ